MAKQIETKIKNKKKNLFEDEEFDLEGENHEEEKPKQLEELSDEDINLDEITADPMIEEDIVLDDTEPESNLSEDEILIIPRIRISKDTDTDDLDEEKDQDNETFESTPTKSTVIKCPYCSEEVLDMEICPLCGNPLKITQETEANREDADLMITDFDIEDQQEYPKKRGSVKTLDEQELDLFGGLPYQDQYTPITTDNI